MKSDQQQPVNDEAGRQRKIKLLRREQPSDPCYLRSERPRFRLRSLLMMITALCLIFAALATRHPLTSAMVGLLILVIIGLVDGWTLAVIERWIGDE